ncbi:DUF4296 domain-containing protein [Ulvibacter sp. MAR_2010_11]|uniref:DUF4296 domain-containing protein n=1 Tax=Ulvibacter sp. MAR_2010_11 TaxID=1250229 RepID=UPI0012FE5FB8|nr:DUF4296 domain-containing protein [Ulvibacter sp. MAR_2010_11]
MLFLLGACQDVKRPEKPDDLIPKEKMVDIFTDAYMMNAARSINLKVLNDNGIKLDSVLYTKYGIDSLQFARSDAYYTSNLNGYIAIFDEVEARLTLLKSEKDSLQLAGTEKIEAAIKKDSAKAAQGLIEPAQSDSN